MVTEQAPAPLNLTPEQLTQVIEQMRRSGMLDELRQEISDEVNADVAGRFSPDSEGLEGVEGGLGSGGFPWRYWKKRDGTVIMGPEPRETLYATYVRKHFEPLFQYGNLPTPGSRVSCCPHLNMKDHSLHILFAQGGAKELSIAQIISAGWHLNPPTVHRKVVTFPQLEGVKVEDIECPECDKPLYGIAGTAQIMQAMRQHGRAAHGWTRRDTDEALYSIGYLTEEPRTRPRRALSRATQVASSAGEDELEDELEDGAQGEGEEVTAGGMAAVRRSHHKAK